MVGLNEKFDCKNVYVEKFPDKNVDIVYIRCHCNLILNHKKTHWCDIFIYLAFILYEKETIVFS